MFTKPPTESRSSFSLHLQEEIQYPSAGHTTTPLKKFGVCQYQVMCLTPSELISEHSFPHHTVIHVLEGHGVLTLNRNKIQLETNVLAFIPACVPYSLQAISDLALLMTLADVVEA